MTAKRAAEDLQDQIDNSTQHGVTSIRIELYARLDDGFAIAGAKDGEVVPTAGM
jgi:hypothetical protein